MSVFWVSYEGAVLLYLLHFYVRSGNEEVPKKWKALNLQNE